MGSSILVTIRTLVVLALMLAMPLLAIPVVGNYVGSLWSGMAPEWLSDEPNSIVEAHPITPPATGETSLNVSTVYNSESNPDVRETDSTNALATLAPRSTSKSYIKQVHEQLKALGANYIRLETIGKTKIQYRFHCEFPVGDSVYARTFERTATDPVVAIERVLADVQSWYISRSANRSTDRGTHR